ncbi:MAG: hypothetical protein CL780_06475 [Chloroflexi bacterium]|nr:hypothetical protein [Chloroflexota bacterium]|tara:strand:- start:31160 stop:32161 length:1002 start_codon:yes stop_codon:yes gene_type:complete
MLKKFLIIGLGSIGERHLKNLLYLEEKNIAVLRTTSRKPRTIDEDSYITFTSEEEAFNWNPNVVLITNPTYLHIPIALKAASNNIHLFIDIPLSNSLEGTEQLNQYIQENKLISLMGYNLRFHPCLQYIHKLLLEETIGKVISVQAECASYLPNWHPWEDYRGGYSADKSMGGGALLAAGVHELDYFRWMFGSFKSIYATTGDNKILKLKNGAEESITLSIEFQNNIIGELHCDLIQQPYSRWCKIIGEKGTIYWNFLENKVMLYHTNNSRWEIASDFSSMDYNETYINQLIHLRTCLENGNQSINSIDQGIENLEAALAAHKSAETKKIVML